MDRLSKQNQPGSRWDFRNQNISIYSYVAVLGSGFATVIPVLALQWLVPLLLLVVQLEQSPDRFVVLSPSVSRYEAPYTDFDHYCHRDSPRNLEGMVMNVLVLVVYAYRVLPRLAETFYETVGEGNSPASRLNALRKTLWDRGIDTNWMRLGYKLEKYMKSVYLALLNLIMLTVLFLTDDPINVILNALAIEFLAEFDVEIARSEWFDGKRRWIKAGAVDMRARAVLKLEVFERGTIASVCREYGISKTDFEAAARDEAGAGEDPWRNVSLADGARARRDMSDDVFLTETDRVWRSAGEYARREKIRDAEWQFNYDEAAACFGRLTTTASMRGARGGILTINDDDDDRLC